MSAALPFRMLEKPWGQDVLPAPFMAPPGQRIGEVWFETPPALPQLLVKYIFTSEKLSVQVHPSDAQTLAAGMGRLGKEECWFIVDAEPDALLGIGFERHISSPDMRAAALDGSIESLLTWHKVQPGDFFYIPPGTVHAIGAGISLVEIQQNTDTTYRLYDYGRPRPLHLSEGIGVANGAPYDDPRRRRMFERGEEVLVEGPLFRLVRYDGALSENVRERFNGQPLLVIPLVDDAVIHGEAIAPGACALALSVADLRLGPTSRGLVAQPLA
ncbi:MAG: class I mannose-6-phosphate isomerase [Sphingomonadales bacterium]|nr:class I mannose-6-phosphate isomerase [Sphingomonadales bacterium]